MEKYRCKCGLGSIEITPVSEDVFDMHTNNVVTNLDNEMNKITVHCNCGKFMIELDNLMINEIEEL